MGYDLIFIILKIFYMSNKKIYIKFRCGGVCIWIFGEVEVGRLKIYCYFQLCSKFKVILKFARVRFKKERNKSIENWKEYVFIYIIVFVQQDVVRLEDVLGGYGGEFRLLKGNEK